MARRLTVAIASTMFVPVILVSCAEPGPPTLEPGSLEAGLPESIWPTDPSLVTDVVCPGLDTELVQQSLTCTATLDAAPITADVVVDEAGAATASVREPLFAVDDAADALAARLATDLGIDPPAVTCERAVVVAAAGVELECIGSRDGDDISFTLVLEGADGAWTLRPR